MVHARRCVERRVSGLFFSETRNLLSAPSSQGVARPPPGVAKKQGETGLVGQASCLPGPPAGRMPTPRCCYPRLSGPGNSTVADRRRGSYHELERPLTPPAIEFPGKGRGGPSGHEDL